MNKQVYDLLTAYLISMNLRHSNNYEFDETEFDIAQSYEDYILDSFGFPRDNTVQTCRKYGVESLTDLPEEAKDELFCTDYLVDGFSVMTTKRDADNHYSFLKKESDNLTKN